MEKNPVRLNPLFRWVKGRQDTGYWILLLAWVPKRWWNPVPFDIHVVKYPTGAYVSPHLDKLQSGRRHYRLNILLTKPPGGEFVSESVIYRNSRVILFRPDLFTHSVTPVSSGTRYVLSFGCSLPKKARK